MCRWPRSATRMTRPSPAARAAAGAQIGQLRTSQSSAPARLMPGRHPAVKRRPTDPDPAESVERDPQIVAATSVAFFTPSPVSRTSSGCGGSWVPSGSGVMEIPRQRANEFWKNRPGIGHSVSPGSRRSRRAAFLQRTIFSRAYGRPRDPGWCPSSLAFDLRSSSLDGHS